MVPELYATVSGSPYGERQLMQASFCPLLPPHDGANASRCVVATGVQLGGMCRLATVVQQLSGASAGAITAHA